MRALADEPKSPVELRQEVDSPPQSTMRSYLRVLLQTGVVERRRRNDFPGNVEYQLAEAGRELLVVADALASWLATFPGTPTAFGSGAAKSAIRALVDGWSTSMVRALAIRPLSLTELNAVIASISYPTLERRLVAMRRDGLVEPLASGGRGTPYRVSEWLRRAITPIAAAARWEGRCLREGTLAITNRDVEAAFLLALPLLRLPTRPSGSCRLGVRVGAGENDAVAGVVVTVLEGEVDSCGTRVQVEADAWALGTTAAWFSTVIECDPAYLKLGGDVELAKQIIAALHEALLGVSPRS